MGNEVFPVRHLRLQGIDEDDLFPWCVVVGEEDEVVAVIADQIKIVTEIFHYRNKCGALFPQVTYVKIVAGSRLAAADNQESLIVGDTG